MRRIITILFVIAILSTGVIFAANVNGLYKGFPIANVNLNGIKITSDVPAILFDSRTLLPVRSVTEAMNSVVQWDQKTQTATIIKPSINMIFVGDVIEEKEGLTIKGAGSYFNTTGSDRWENLYVEIGPMERRAYEYRIAVYDPKGGVVGTSAVETQMIDKRGLIAYIPVENMTYSLPGQYKFKFQIKYDREFQSVGETVAVVE
ncbi:MAG: stalk domain-containing protein [Eubacteriales bacterium]|nr:stalk domain-containing protein [Eubacteriales bacterium]